MSTAPPLPLPQQLLAVARDIKLSHTVFALPFALLATFLAAGWAERAPRVGEFLLILLCMVTARTYAMAVNRWADAGIDAQNARTAARVLPNGLVSKPFMAGVCVVNAILFVSVAACFFFAYDNAWPVILSPLVLLVLGGYSYTKRFTWACHAVLGFALAISPVAAAIAIEPGYLARPTIWLLMAMVWCWVAGFDILYALQDTEADRELGLYSIPSRLGVGPALWISRALHAASAGALIAVALVAVQLGVLFVIAAGLTCGLLLIEHALVWGGRTHQLNMAFFTVNGVISVALGVAGIVDVLTAS
ncbi:MAG: UbiA-like polyprenyltransferase [Phycisphaeraceae bacterium]